MAEAQALVAAGRVYFADGAKTDLLKWSITPCKFQEYFSRLTKDNFVSTVEFEHKIPSLTGVFDSYKTIKKFISKSGIAYHDDLYIKFKIVKPKSGDLVICISTHPDGH